MRVTAVDRTERSDNAFDVEIRFTSPLPRVLEAMVPEDFAICRRESWTLDENGGQGRIEVLFPLLPLSATIAGEVHALGPKSATVSAVCDLVVNAPFIGRFCERSIADFYWNQSVHEPRYLVAWMVDQRILAPDTRPEDILTFHDRVEEVIPRQAQHA